MSPYPFAFCTLLFISAVTTSHAEPAVPANSDQAPTSAESEPTRLMGRAVLIGPQGHRQEFSFGNPSGASLREAIKDGGAQLELKIAPDTEALEALATELTDTIRTDGVGRALFDLTVDSLRKIETYGELQVRGALVGPDADHWRLEFGNDATSDPPAIDQKMEDGGAHLELGVVPGSSLRDLLSLASHAPEAMRLLEFGLEHPDKLPLLDQALQDPNLIPLLEKAMQDPQTNGLLQKALQNPALTELLTSQLATGNAGALLGLLGNSAKPNPQPSEVPPPAQEPDPELENLRKELAAQRALLERILEKLPAE